MIASSTPSLAQVALQDLQNSLTAESSAIKQSQAVQATISQTAVDEFALRFNAAMIQMLTARGVSDASPLSKKLRAYASAGVTPVKGTSRFV